MDDNGKNYISKNYILVESDGKDVKCDFFMSEFPITKGDFHEIDDEKEKDEIVRVTSVEAMKYCNCLSRKYGVPIAYDETEWILIDEKGKFTDNILDVKGFRMPTPTEWNYAATGGKNSECQKFEIQVVLDTYFKDFIYFVDNMKITENYKKGEFSKNSLGIGDILGNIAELTCHSFKGKTVCIVCKWWIYYTNYDCIPTYYVNGENYKENEKKGFRIVIKNNNL